MLTDFYEKVIRTLFCGDCWTYSRDALASASGSILADRQEQNPSVITLMENLGCASSVRLLTAMLEEKLREEEPQKKEFDVEEILKEAGECE